MSLVKKGEIESIQVMEVGENRETELPKLSEKPASHAGKGQISDNSNENIPHFISVFCLRS